MGLAEDSRSNMLMRAVALTGEQITKYGYLMEEATTADTANLTYEAYVQDAAARPRPRPAPAFPRTAQALRPKSHWKRTIWCSSLCRMTRALPPR